MLQIRLDLEADRPGRAREQGRQASAEGERVVAEVADCVFYDTDKGVRDIKDSPHRADSFNEFAEKSGARVVSQYWTIGTHDGVLVLDAPSDEIAASVLMHLGAAGNVRTTTLRAYDWGEAQELIADA